MMYLGLSTTAMRAKGAMKFAVINWAQNVNSLSSIYCIILIIRLRLVVPTVLKNPLQSGNTTLVVAWALRLNLAVRKCCSEAHLPSLRRK